MPKQQETIRKYFPYPYTKHVNFNKAGKNPMLRMITKRRGHVFNVLQMLHSTESMEKHGAVLHQQLEKCIEDYFCDLRGLEKSPVLLPVLFSWGSGILGDANVSEGNSLSLEIIMVLWCFGIAILNQVGFTPTKMNWGIVGYRQIIQKLRKAEGVFEFILEFMKSRQPDDLNALPEVQKANIEAMRNYTNGLIHIIVSQKVVKSDILAARICVHIYRCMDSAEIEIQNLSTRMQKSPQTKSDFRANIIQYRILYRSLALYHYSQHLYHNVKGLESSSEQNNIDDKLFSNTQLGKKGDLGIAVSCMILATKQLKELYLFKNHHWGSYFTSELYDRLPHFQELTEKITLENELIFRNPVPEKIEMVEGQKIFDSIPFSLDGGVVTKLDFHA